MTVKSAVLASLLAATFCATPAAGQSLGFHSLPSSPLQFLGYGYGAGRHAPIVHAPLARPANVPNFMLVPGYCSPQCYQAIGCSADSGRPSPGFHGYGYRMPEPGSYPSQGSDQGPWLGAPQTSIVAPAIQPGAATYGPSVAPANSPVPAGGTVPAPQPAPARPLPPEKLPGPGDRQVFRPF